MIGQKRCIETLNNIVIKNNSNSSFSPVILYGKDGMGKRTLAKEVCSNAGYTVCFVEDLKAETAKNLIVDCTARCMGASNIVIVITDLHKVSKQVQNILLKVLEDDLKAISFILTANNRNSVLDTIANRCIGIRLDNYTKDDLLSVLDDSSKIDYVSTVKECLDIKNVDIHKLNILVDILLNFGHTKNYLDLYDAINKICFNDDDNGDYSFNLVINAMYVKLATCLWKNVKKNVDLIELRHNLEIYESFVKYVGLVRSSSINKKSSFENFLLGLD